MPLIPEDRRRQRAEIARQAAAGEIAEFEAGARFVELDPDFGGGYVLLGRASSNAGDFEAAESYFWKGLERLPCESGVYQALAAVRLERFGGDDGTGRRLGTLALWKLAFRANVPEEEANFFSTFMKDADLDMEDPASYETIATAIEKETPTPSEIRERLLPYELFNDLQRHTWDGLDDELLRELLAHSELLIPLWRGALRAWEDDGAALSADTIGLALALLGETAGPEIVEDLLQLATNGDRTVFLHANWALWRIGVRFPAEALAAIRAATPEAAPILRCALADQLDLLTETPGLEEALLDLLQGFAGFCRDDSAAYVLSMVVEALQELGRMEEAERVFREYRPLLSEEDRRYVSERRRHGISSELVEAGIDGLAIGEICSDLILMEGEDDEDDEDDENDDDYEGPHEPVVAPVRPGRNEPCWCGSGRKYKKCHLAADEEEARPNQAAPEPSAAEVRESRLRAELVDCVARWGSKEELAQAALLYFGRTIGDGPLPDAELTGGFVAWYIYDFRPSGGPTLVENYLKRRGGRLTVAERELLEAWRDARFGIWEVQRVEKGTGVELKDLFSEDRFFVEDVSSSRSMVRWDCVINRIYRSEGHWYFVGDGTGVPRTLLPELLARIDREMRETGEPAAAFLRSTSHRWQRVVHELHRAQFANLSVRNTEGDELEFCSAEYRVLNEAPLVAALAAARPFEAEETDSDGARAFAWLEHRSDDGPRRSYGRIELRDGKLRLECNSRKRLEIGRELIEKHGGAWLEHAGDTVQSQESLKRKVISRRNRKTAIPESDSLPEAAREVLSDLKKAHYAHWVDERLPALDGQTPREAARSEVGRQALERVLRLMENSEERERRRGADAFDFSSVRRELGMPVSAE